MRQFALFCVAGTLGFLVDAGIVQLLVAVFAADPYAGRAISFLCAVTVTWLFNRRYTFVARRERHWSSEWLHYIAVNLAGFALNYAVYAGLVYGYPLVRTWPLLGVAAGSVVGLSLNYLSARFWVFRHRISP